jgi:RNAse (barnase) inhibitor barstar
MKTVIIDGQNFSSLKSFYDEVEKKFTKDLGWSISRNLDAFNDGCN